MSQPQTTRQKTTRRKKDVLFLVRSHHICIFARKLLKKEFNSSST